MELIEYLTTNNFSTIIWLSEDAKSCISHVKYDSKTDKFVGFTLPFNEDGFPA